MIFDEKVALQMPVTLKDLSKHLSLSVATVSKALNDYSDISADTKALVLQASDDLGYHPNTTARNLRRQRTEKIGVIHPIKAFESEVMVGFFRGLSLAAQTHNYNLVLYTISLDNPESLRQICRSKEIDGLILMGTSLSGVSQASVDLLQKEDLPFVILGHPVNDPIPFIATDNHTGTSSLFKHLIHLGHKKIAYISRSSDFENNNERFQAYKEALKQAKLEFNPDYVVEAPYTAYSGMGAMRVLLELPEVPSAVVCFNDHIAIDACRAALEKGLSVPEDIAIAGYGNIPSTLITTPAITTVAMPLKEMGETAVEALLSLMETSKVPSSQRFKTQLIVRASTQPSV